MTSLLLAQLTLAVAASAAGWVTYFRWKDSRRPEPLWLLWATAGGGALAAGLAWVGFAGLESLGVVTDWEVLQGPRWSWAIFGALRIGALEETAKLLPVAIIAVWVHHFDEPLDGPVYVGCSALGFATVESLLLIRNGEFGTLDGLARALTAPIAHGLLSAPAGLGLAVAVLRSRPRALVIGFVISTLSHALYDLLMARPELPPGPSAVVVLVLWIWLMRLAPRLARLRATVRGR